MVVANDADPIRINTLKSRYSRCMSQNMLITCATAEELCCRIQQPVFDRILADVPCSGDGTIRKFPHIWRLFRPRMSLDLHKVQLSIAKASINMLKPGGRMVYSTCSINPMEDEAVVSALLQMYWHCGLRLVDTQAEGLLPDLRSRAGLSHWRCDTEVFVSGESDETVRRESLSRLPEFVPSMFPPTEDDAKRLHLERCHRILPQDNDTGGFFVAVLELQDCSNLSSSDLEYFHSKKLKLKSQNGQESSITVSNVMKELGYNPKRKQSGVTNPPKKSKKVLRQHKIKHDEFSINTVIDSPHYRPIPNHQLRQLIDSLDLYNDGPLLGDISGERQSLHLVAATDVKEGGSEEVLSLVSAGVYEALETWAQVEKGLLVHAGAPVATYLHSHPQVVSLVADGVTSLLPLMRGNSTTRLSCRDFKAFARLRCEGALSEITLSVGDSMVEKMLVSADQSSMIQV